MLSSKCYIALLLFYKFAFDKLEHLYVSQFLFISLPQAGVYLVARAYVLGYVVKFDQSSRVYVIAPRDKANSGHLAGLCGDYNGKDDDDFKKPDTSLADNALVFAKAWSDTSGACPEPTNADSCEANSFRKPWATKGFQYSFLME